MKWFDYESPNSVREAVDLLAEAGDNARVLAGGTDLIVQMRVGRRQPALVIDGKNIPALNELTYDPEAGLTIGAAVPCYRIYANHAVANAYPALIDCTSLIGGTQIQGRATLGGNLCNAAPSGDSIPAMIALGGVANVAGPNGSRRQIAVEDFCTGPGQNALQKGEMLVSIHFPAPQANSGARYIRFIPRNEMDIAVAGVGVSVVLNNGNIQSARLALASVAPTPLYVKEIGDAIAGKPANEETIALAGQIASDAARPITDMRGTIEYRRHLCGVLTRRSLTTAIERAKENN